MFLQLLALSGFFVGINSIFGTLLRVRHRINELIIMNVIGAIVILGGSYLLINQGLGLIGIGWAYLLGQGVVSGVYLGLRVRRK